jgi:hypothetical protein
MTIRLVTDGGHVMEPEHLTMLIHGSLPWALCPQTDAINLAGQYWAGRETPRGGIEE